MFLSKGVIGIDPINAKIEGFVLINERYLYIFGDENSIRHL